MSGRAAGITLMVDVARDCRRNPSGYVPTPALVAPIEFTLRARRLLPALGWTYASRRPSRSRTCWPAPKVRASNEKRAMSARRRPPDRRQAATCSTGPIDLIIEAFGAAPEVERAYGQAVERFGDILADLGARAADPAVVRWTDAYPLLQGTGGAPHGRGRVAPIPPSTSRRWAAVGRARWPTRCLQGPW